ncbi:hypothetical protein HDE_09367 [Halotydeus destructor]|nr:hypothetical protein HDE_09367 [Halotydeus destructor]
MSWILPYLDQFSVQLSVEADLLQLYDDSKSEEERTVMKLDPLYEDELISIFSWLKPKTLVGIERVSKQFFRLVDTTFHKMKYFKYQGSRFQPDFINLEGEKVEKTFNAVSFINRFGPSLQTLPFALLVHPLGDNENLMYDAKYFRQLAWRFPQALDFGLITELTILLLSVYLKAVRTESKLRKLHVCYALNAMHLLYPGEVELFGNTLKTVIAMCPRLDKLRLGLLSRFEPAMLENGEQFVTDFGKLSFELASKVNRLVLLDKAALAIKGCFSQRPVSLQELKLRFSPTDYCTDKEVRSLCRFAPHVKKLTIRAETSVLKHLVALDKLEAIEFPTLDQGELPFPASPENARESMETFLKTVGKRLKTVKFGLVNPEHSMPIGIWLTKYCPQISKLRLAIIFDQHLSGLRLPNLTHCELYILSGLTETELEMILQNNRALKYMMFTCYDMQSYKLIREHIKKTAARQLHHRSLTVDIISGCNLTESVRLKL